MTKVKFRTSDGKLFEVDQDVIECSAVLLTMFDLLGTDDEEIPLPTITSYIFEKVIQWAEFHRLDSRIPDGSDDGLIQETRISVWDAEYIKMSIDTLYKVMVAADYLEIDNLRELIGKVFATIVKEASAEELKKIFKIEFTRDGNGD